MPTKKKVTKSKKPASAKQLAARAAMKVRMQKISASRKPDESMKAAVSRYYASK